MAATDVHIYNRKEHIKVFVDEGGVSEISTTMPKTLITIDKSNDEDFSLIVPGNRTQINYSEVTLPAVGTGGPGVEQHNTLKQLIEILENWIEPVYGVTSTSNATTTPLVAAGVYTGTWEDVEDYNQFDVVLASDVDSAELGVKFQFSDDASTVRFTNALTFHSPEQVQSQTHLAKYFRIKYTNGLFPQSKLFISVLHHKRKNRSAPSRIVDPPTDDVDAEYVKAIIYTRGQDGTYGIQQGTELTGLEVSLLNPLTASGDMRVSNMTPIEQYVFNYTINPRYWSFEHHQPLNTTANALLASITTGVTGATNGTYAGLFNWSTSGNGSGATFDVTVAGGTVTALTVINNGISFATGDTITFRPGVMGTGSTGPVVTLVADDLTYGLDIVPNSLLSSITTAVAGGTVATYDGVAYTTSGSGSGAVFGVTVNASGTEVVQLLVLDKGSGYAAGDSITFSNNALGSGSTGPVYLISETSLYKALVPGVDTVLSSITTQVTGGTVGTYSGIQAYTTNAKASGLVFNITLSSATNVSSITVVQGGDNCEPGDIILFDSNIFGTGSVGPVITLVAADIVYGINTLINNDPTTELAGGVGLHTYTGPTWTTSGNGTGAAFSVTLSSPTNVSNVTVRTCGKYFKTGDTITFDANQFGTGSTGPVITLGGGDLLVDSSTIKQQRGLAVVGTGTSAGAAATLVTRRRLSYRAGQGAECRFTALFKGNGSLDSQQWVGLGDTYDGFFFGYIGEVFGIIHMRSGNPTFIAQSAWNIDKADGTGALDALDWSKGNVFSIQFQYLGFGNIRFAIEKTNLGRYQPVHDILYPNTNVRPSLDFPSLPYQLHVFNGQATNNLEVGGASVGLFVQGASKSRGILNSIAGKNIEVKDTLEQVLVIRNRTDLLNITVNLTTISCLCVYFRLAHNLGTSPY